MKTLQENDGCKFALTTSEKPNRYGFGRLGKNGSTGARVKGPQPDQGAVLGASYPHLFCGEPTIGDGVYCAEHHKLCRRGDGKDVRSLAAMIDAMEHSVSHRRTPYAEHTDPIDEELKRT